MKSFNWLRDHWFLIAAVALSALMVVMMGSDLINGAEERVCYLRMSRQAAFGKEGQADSLFTGKGQKGITAGKKSWTKTEPDSTAPSVRDGTFREMHPLL